MSRGKELLARLRADNRPRKVPLLGEDVYVSQITIAEQSKITAMFPEDSAKRQAAILVLKICDADGKPLFTADDRDALVGEPGANKFAAVWNAINGVSLDVQAEK
ncbi:phage tail assembly chaperone family protein, TAC [Reyranella sp.]|uniref:phage tail assembly chaperone family protein, TAC n=1 Tax=Reyranella sp. TaxID=1929291 RepID=UPI003D0B9F7F